MYRKTGKAPDVLITFGSRRPLSHYHRVCLCVKQRGSPLSLEWANDFYVPSVEIVIRDETRWEWDPLSIYYLQTMFLSSTPPSTTTTEHEGIVIHAQLNRGQYELLDRRTGL